MRSPLSIVMTVTAIVLLGILCVLSYGGYENQPRKSEQVQPLQQQSVPDVPPVQDIDESNPSQIEMTHRLEQRLHQPGGHARLRPPIT